jgi:hypothetical protein
MNRATSASGAKSMARNNVWSGSEASCAGKFCDSGRSEVFEERISRCYALLYFTACLVFGSRMSQIVRVDVQDPAKLAAMSNSISI